MPDVPSAILKRVKSSTHVAGTRNDKKANKERRVPEVSCKKKKGEDRELAMPGGVEDD